MSLRRHPPPPPRLSRGKVVPQVLFFAKHAEIDSSLALPTSPNALPEISQEEPGRQTGQVR